MTESKTYEEFVEKFKPKKTTDDCYTPQPVYDVVLDYCVERWGINQENVVRPFWPGGDYENFDYPEGCVVVDNPPFSILSKIQRFYLDRGIKFFLFAPALTAFSGRKNIMEVDHILCGLDITYENGAVVRTGFLTNLEPGVVAESSPELSARLKAVNEKPGKSLPKYKYPNEVVTSAQCDKLAAHGVRFQVRREDCAFITKLDSMPKGKSIFGGGLLLSERAAAEHETAERAAAERVAAERAFVFELSERERGIQANLG